MTEPAINTLSEIVESKVTTDKNDKNRSILTWFTSHWRNIFSEFISTLMLVLLGCMGALPIPGMNSVVYTPLGFGMVVMFNVQIFGHISGAYMNPAVTLATVIWGSVSLPLGIAYVIIQCLGATAGYGILNALVFMDLAANGVCVSQTLSGQNVLQSLGIEIIITAALIFINCAIWDPVNKDKQDSASIKFGLTIVGLSLVAGPLTGASMNPARSLGPAIWTNIWTEHWIYWVGPFVGSTFAAVLYKFIFLEKLKEN